MPGMTPGGHVRFVPRELNLTDPPDRPQAIETFRRIFAGLVPESPDLETILAEGGRYRVRDVPFKVDSIVRTEGMTIGLVEDMARAAHHQLRLEINGQQENGDWILAGFRIKRISMARRARTPAEKAISRRAYTILSGESKPMRLAEKLISEIAINVELAFYDIARAPEIDQWFERTGLTSGTLYGGRIPPRLVREYSLAREIIAERKVRPLFEQPVAEVVERVALSEAQIAHAKRMAERGTSIEELSVLLNVPTDLLETQLGPPQEPAQIDDNPAWADLPEDADGDQG